MAAGRVDRTLPGIAVTIILMMSRCTKSSALAAAFCALPICVPHCRAAESDALSIDANIQARHMPYGTIIDPVFASATSDQIAGYTRCGDSALWTGHYLAAEAFRYNVTRAAAALANIKSALAGIQSLLDATGTDVLARCAFPAGSPFAAGIESEEKSNGIYTNSATGTVWVGNTSRDEYSGVMFGLGAAYDLVDDDAVKTSISRLATRLAGFLQNHAWDVVLPDGAVSTTFIVRPDEMLAILQVAQHVNPGQFAKAYADQRSALSYVMSVPIGVDIGSDSSYFKFNLDYINLYNLIRLESGPARSDYLAGYALLRGHTAPHQNAFFDAIDRAIQGANAARDSETLALLNQWLSRPRRDPSIDLSNAVTVCNGQACAPIPVPSRVPTDFLWQRSPFQLSGGGSGTIETAGIDYILPYWMARYYGVLGDPTVQSAAWGNMTIAPGSLASIFGAGMAAATAQAGSQPLPVSLGGVTVMMTDAAGAQRAAPLDYVSPSQINLLVPDGTAPGAATFTIANGGATTTAIATVANVAPGLFSANSTGSGVAAATAVRTQAANPAIQSPVPVFTCQGSNCVSVPINLGVDTPVYLTLYGTGIRNRSAPANVAVTINGVAVPVLYAGPQGSFAGLDQVNVALILNLRGSGESNVIVTVDGVASNAVTVNIE